MFASKNKSKSFIQIYQIFSQKLGFFGKFSLYYHTVFTANYNESGKSSRKRFSISFQHKKRNLDYYSFLEAMFTAVTNNQSPDSGFIEFSLLHSQNYSSVETRRMKIVLNTAAAEGSCCFVLISGIINEAEMYDTNKKRSLDLSDYKKQHCLNFWNFAHLFKI